MNSPTDSLLKETLSADRAAADVALRSGLSALRWRRRRQRAIPVLAGAAILLAIAIILPRPEMPKKKSGAHPGSVVIHTDSSMAPTLVRTSVSGLVVIRSENHFARTRTQEDFDRIARVDDRGLFALFRGHPSALVDEGAGPRRFVIFR